LCIFLDRLESLGNLIGMPLLRGELPIDKESVRQFLPEIEKSYQCMSDYFPSKMFKRFSHCCMLAEDEELL
jgi:hypothetical protein